MGIFGLGALAPYREINEEKSFDVGKINEMQIDMTSIPVHILQTKAGNEIKFHLYGKAKRGLELVSETNRNIVVVQAKRKLDGLPIEDVSLDIYIPEDYEKSLLIKTTSGIIKVDSIHLTTFTCNTSSGGLETEKLTADRIDVSTTSGVINIKELNSSELKIKGSSSNVTITCREFNNRNIDIVTTSGNTIVNLPSDAEFKYKIVTNGKVQSDFPIKTSENSKAIFEGQIGSKSNKVFLQASSGNVTLVKG